MKKIHKRQSIYSCDVHRLENALLFNPPANVGAIGTEDKKKSKSEQSEYCIENRNSCKRNRIIRFASRVCFGKFNFSLCLLISVPTKLFHFFFFLMRISLQKVCGIVYFDLLLFFFHLICAHSFIIPISTVCWPRGILLYYIQ